MRSKNIKRFALATIGVLLIPLVAMQFTSEVQWTLFDFAFAGALLFGTGVAYEFVASRGSSVAYRAAVGIAAVTSLLLVWVNGAVGIIGNEDNPLNLMYLGVIAIGIIGAGIARFKPRGMFVAALVASFAQAAVPVIGLIIEGVGMNSGEKAIGAAGIFMLSWFFALLFAISALLFRHSAES